MARIVQARIKWRVAGDFAENVWNFRTSDEIENDWTIAVRLYNAIVDQAASPNTLMSRLLLATSDEAFISTISTRVIFPNGGNRYANQLQVNELRGLVAENLYTGEIAMVCNWLSLEEPSKMGRTFLPGVPTTFVEGGRWNATAQTAANNFMNEMVGGISNGGTNFDLTLWRPSEETDRLVSDGYLSPNVGQQSRRGTGE